MAHFKKKGGTYPFSRKEGFEQAHDSGRKKRRGRGGALGKSKSAKNGKERKGRQVHRKSRLYGLREKGPTRTKRKPVNRKWSKEKPGYPREGLLAFKLRKEEEAVRKRGEASTLCPKKKGLP